MLIVGLALAIFQQIVGINTVIYYAPTILRFTGNSVSSAITQTVFIGLTNVVFTVVAVLLLDRFGRRVFLLVGTAGLVVSLLVLGLFFASAGVRHAVPDLALIALIGYIASFAIGLGPVFWLMISEIFPLHLRSPAASAIQCALSPTHGCCCYWRRGPKRNTALSREKGMDSTSLPTPWRKPLTPVGSTGDRPA